MTTKDQAMLAETVDRFQKIVTLGIFVLAISYSFEVAKFLVNESTADTLQDIASALAILVIFIVLPGVLMLAYKKLKYKAKKMEIEGFILEGVQKASVLAFSLTFVFMVAIDGMLVFNNDVGLAFLPEMPTKFYLKAILAFTLFVQSIAFFIFTRDSDKGEDDE